MDAYEATRVVLSRIQSLDPENAHRIMGLLLLQEHGEQEMIRLAFAPETLLQSVVLKTLKELGLAPPSIPVTHSGDASPLLLRQNSTSRLLAASSPSSWAPPPVFSRSKSGMSSNGLSPSLDEHQRSDELVSPNILGISPFYGGADLIDDFQLPDRLSFLGDNGTAPNSNHALSVAANVSRSSDAFNLDICRSPSGNVDGAMLPNKIGWGINGYHHCRSSSAAELCLGDPAAGYGWKPCLYFARGYCKNGSACRFLHGLPEDGVAAKMDAAVEQQFEEFLQRSKSQRIGDVSQLMASAFPFSPTGSVPPSPSSSSSKCLNFWHQHQHQHPQNESQRVATAAAAALMLAGDDSHKFIGRSRMERNDLMTTPGSRQIYLTFPADSTFSEEDVSNYFSIYGPVQDVRIPFQQKRMFGFVTFVYPETVKLILAKGNPHFVCDSRVLVKPYKEKGKVPEKFRKQQQQQQAETLDLQQLAGARMMFNNGSFNQELLLRRKLEEQQQAAERQRAIELQAMRFTGLRLNLNNISFSSAPASINSPSLLATQPIGSVDSSNNGTNFCSSSSQEDSLNEEKSLSVAEIEEKSNGYDKNAAAGESNPKAGSDLLESSADHNLPDSPFASPTKSLFMLDSLSNYEDGTSVVNTSNNPDHLIASPLLPITSLPDKPSLGSCLLHMPRLSSGHGAFGM